MDSRSGRRGKDTVADAMFAAFPHTVAGLNRDPDPALGIDPGVLTREQLVEWMGSGRLEPYADALEKAGNCAHPIRLRGSSMRVDKVTGEVLSTYASAQELDGLTYIRCGNRREAVCPSCSRLYAGDTFHLIRAGVVGGKTVPEHVADNPLVFATLTAPSFGRVHGRRDNSQLCHPQSRGARVCEHGRLRTCARRHREDDQLLGKPLWEHCYDYESHLVWHWWAPALFRRFTIALRRSLAKELGVAATRLPELATVQYAKVAESQRRGAIHFHALIRLDGPRIPVGFARAAAGIDGHQLARHISRVARSVRLRVPGVDLDDPNRMLAFGRQVDARPVTPRRRPDDPTRALSPEQVAGYLAKYATKSTGDDPHADTWHHRRLRTVCRTLAERARAAENPDPELDDGLEPPYARLGHWVHMYGFRGHFASKSRRYSITLGALRRARRRVQTLRAQAEQVGTSLDLAALDEARLLADNDTETTLVIGTWQYAGTGWASDTERTLALAAAARAREYDRDRARARQTASNSGK